MTVNLSILIVTTQESVLTLENFTLGYYGAMKHSAMHSQSPEMLANGISGRSAYRSCVFFSVTSR